MRTALDADTSALDDHERKFVADIREHGWVHTSVFGDEKYPGFSYTTGFWLRFNFPEIITFSLRRETSHDAFWHMYRELAAGQSFAIRNPIENIFANLKAVLLPVPEVQFQEHLGWNRLFYGGNNFKCLQLVWPDSDGKFPWRFDASAKLQGAQPDLTKEGWSGLRQH